MTASQEASQPENWKRQDDHPDIASGLLNIECIERYANSSSLISPFDRSSANRVKPASYGLPLHGHCVWWDDNGERHDVFLSADPIAAGADGLPVQSFVKLARNSIMFVTLGPKISLPYFIAARFNLRIKWIYAGILVGTGPLVDPGFNGSLTCPIHNLTNDDYILRADDGAFAWIEFTKLSGSSEPPSMSTDSVGRYASRSLDKLLREANNGKPIRSSIPEEFAKVAREANASATSAKAANESAKSGETAAVAARNVATVFSVGVIIALVALCVSFYNGVTSLSAQNHSLSITGSKNYEDDRLRLEAKITSLQNELKADETTLKALSVRPTNRP